MLRSYLRQRAMLVEYAAHHVQHMHKALTQMNIKLQHVISDITGRTGTEIVEAIVGGEREPRKLAKLRDPRIKADEKTIAESLRGHWKQEHIFELTQALELYKVYRAKMEECDSEIELHLRRFEDRSDGGVPADRAGRKYRPWQRAQVRCAHTPVQDDRGGPDRDRRSGQLHGAEGGERGWGGYEPVADGEALRLMAGPEPPTTG